MSEPTAALAALRASTADLLKGLAEYRWADGDLAAASLCEGWTRGHVLTHLARNADGITATLSGALRGEVVPRYPDGWDARNEAIAAGSGHPAAEIVADLTESSERLDRVFGAVTEADRWEAPTDQEHPAADWVSRRLVEVEFHRVDLAGSYGPDRWPPLLVADQLPAAGDSLASRTDAALRVVVAEAGSVVPSLAGREWTVGDGEPRVITGPDWALLAWLAGRGSVVQGALGERLPALEPWR